MVLFLFVWKIASAAAGVTRPVLRWLAVGGLVLAARCLASQELLGLLAACAVALARGVRG